MDQSYLVCRKQEITSTSIPQSAHLAVDASSTPPDSPAHSPLAKKKSRNAYLWGLGSTLLSVVGFVAMMLFEQYDHALCELRNDLKHFNETSSEFVKKDSLVRVREHFKDFFKEMQALKVERQQMEKELRISEKAREEMAHEHQRLLERLAFVEGRQGITHTIETTASTKNKETAR